MPKRNIDNLHNKVVIRSIRMEYRMLRVCLKVLIVVLAICITALLMTGCNGTVSPQPIPHPIAGTSLMLIPRGTNIGNQVAPEDGVYIGESILLEQQRKQREEEAATERKKRQKII